MAAAPGARRGVHVVLVGKGITFDTGGLNLKPGDGMSTMYTDMAGGAAVLGALRADRRQRAAGAGHRARPGRGELALGFGDPARATCRATSAGGPARSATPTPRAGIVLADALAYAAARLRPTALVDVATLTGAMKIALGLRTGGLFATSDQLANALVAAGAASRASRCGGCRCPSTTQPTARLAGSPTRTTRPATPAASPPRCSCSPFAAGLPWAHLDIAGPGARGEGRRHPGQGATGFGARLLGRWVESLV